RRPRLARTGARAEAAPAAVRTRPGGLAAPLTRPGPPGHRGPGAGRSAPALVPSLPGSFGHPPPRPPLPTRHGQATNPAPVAARAAAQWQRREPPYAGNASLAEHHAWRSVPSAPGLTGRRLLRDSLGCRGWKSATRAKPRGWTGGPSTGPTGMTGF